MPTDTESVFTASKKPAVLRKTQATTRLGWLGIDAYLEHTGVAKYIPT